MLRIKARLIGLIICCFLMACDAKISENKEPVFNNSKPESREYKHKLAEKLVKSQADVFVFEKYIDDSTIGIIVSGHDFAANCIVKVYDWKGIEGIKQAKGGGYGAAELIGLQLEVQDLGSPDGETFVYKDINYILD